MTFTIEASRVCKSPVFPNKETVLLQGIVNQMIPADAQPKKVILRGFDRIGHHAFFGRMDIEKVELNDVVHISSYAFSNSGIKKLKKAEQLRTIEDSAFSECSKLESFPFHEGLEQIWLKAFANSGIASATIPGSVKRIGRLAFSNCKHLRTLVVKEGVEIIRPRAFYDCGLASVTLPKSLRSVQERAFAGCLGIQKASLPPEQEWFVCAYNIKWDCDEDDLPEEVYIPFDEITDWEDEDDIIDQVSDWLSNVYGFCHEGFLCDFFGHSES